MRAILVSIAVVLAACGSGSTTGGDARRDAIGAGTVACGTATAPMTCSLPDEACCEFAPGAGTDYCYPAQGGVCEGGAPMRCDGPEDCIGGESCCYSSTSAGSSCTETPTCAPGGGQIMCHLGDDTPCGAGGVCCELGSGGPSSGSPFGTCRTGSCPV